ncbi:MAG TPA: [acyl-carrier-protein] S-malonyltransferase [Planctomycetaceae bacterium]|nr:[acyl-carrier-protein] S-malonyltransferase [Planctomycetaceae bacterium]
MSLDVDSIGLVFPGQGAQFPGMGRWLIDNFPVARDLYVRASDLLSYDLIELSIWGPANRLDATEFSQPALFVSSMAAAEVMRLEQPEAIAKVKAVAGLSLGEYSAICFAGGLDFDSALRLVQRRGQAMQAAADQVQSGMASVIGMELDALQAVCDQVKVAGEVLQPANILCRGNIAVSGHRTALARLDSVATAAGASRVIPLSVAGAFHTELMNPAAAALAEAVAEASFMPLTLPVFSNVDALIHTDSSDFKSLLSRQLVSPVLWERCVTAMIEYGCKGFVEVGSGKVLRGTIRRIDRKMPVDGFGDAPDGPA